MRTVFEPLHPQAIPSARPFSNAYVPRDAEARELRAYMDGVFSGANSSIWADYRVRPDRMVPRLSTLASAKKSKMLVGRYMNLWRNYRKYRHGERKGVITKFIRANLMLGWLEANYDLAVLFVVRHPGAVVASQLEKGTEWDARALESFKRDRLLWRDFLGAHEGFLTSSLSNVELYTTIWCIQNALPIEESISKGRPVTYYEKLIAESDSEWSRITGALQLEDIPESRVVSKPSQQSSKTPESGAMDGTSRVSRWQKRFSNAELDSMQKVLDEFHVSIYKAHDVMPLS